MTIQQQFNRSTLSAISFRGSSPSDIFQDASDLLVLSLAAQERCCSIIRSSSSPTTQAVILGIPTDFHGCDAATTAALQSWETRLRVFASSAESPESLSLSPIHRDATFRTLIGIARDLGMKLGRPIDISIDLTCCPLYIALGLISLTLQSGLARRLHVFYAEGKYPEAHVSDNSQEIFTSGEWNVSAIPGLHNSWTPGGPRLYVVAVGFEGNKTLRLCERREPDNVLVVFPEPGVLPGYAQRTAEQNKAFFERFGIEDADLIRANAADAVALWKALSAVNLLQQKLPDVEYLCCGTKPHGLGMALQVLCTGNGVLCDIVAEERLHTDVKEAGAYWRYDIENLAAL